MDSYTDSPRSMTYGTPDRSEIKTSEVMSAGRRPTKNSMGSTTGQPMDTPVCGIFGMETPPMSLNRSSPQASKIKEKASQGPPIKECSAKVAKRLIDTWKSLSPQDEVTDHTILRDLASTMICGKIQKPHGSSMRPSSTPGKWNREQHSGQLKRRQLKPKTAGALTNEHLSGANSLETVGAMKHSSKAQVSMIRSSWASMDFVSKSDEQAVTSSNIREYHSSHSDHNYGVADTDPELGMDSYERDAQLVLNSESIDQRDPSEAEPVAGADDANLEDLFSTKNRLKLTDLEAEFLSKNSSTVGNGISSSSYSSSVRQNSRTQPKWHFDEDSSHLGMDNFDLMAHIVLNQESFNLREPSEPITGTGKANLEDPFSIKGRLELEDFEAQFLAENPSTIDNRYAGLPLSPTFAPKTNIDGEEAYWRDRHAMTGPVYPPIHMRGDSTRRLSTSSNASSIKDFLKDKAMTRTLKIGKILARKVRADEDGENLEKRFLRENPVRIAEGYGSVQLSPKLCKERNYQGEMDYWVDRFAMTGPVYPPPGLAGQQAMMRKSKSRDGLINNMLFTKSTKNHNVEKRLHHMVPIVFNLAKRSHPNSSTTSLDEITTIKDRRRVAKIAREAEPPIVYDEGRTMMEKFEESLGDFEKWDEDPGFGGNGWPMNGYGVQGADDASQDASGSGPGPSSG